MPASPIQLRAYLETLGEKTRNKGARIFQQSSKDSEFAEFDPEDDDSEWVVSEGPRSIKLQVPSQSDGYLLYDVSLSWNSKGVNGRCDCYAFAEYGPCKHIAAALHYLIDALPPEEAVVKKKPSARVTLLSRPAGEAVLRENMSVTVPPSQFFSSVDWRIGHYSASRSDLSKIREDAFKPEEGIWDLTFIKSAQETFRQRITYDKDQGFVLSCTCLVKQSPCPHLYAVACYLFEKYGGYYFVQFKDFTREKAKALAELGLSPDDPEAAELRFNVSSSGALQCTVPSWLWPVTVANQRILKLQENLGVSSPTVQQALFAQVDAFHPAILFQTATNALPFPFELTVVNTAGGKFAKLNTANSENLPALKSAVPREVYSALLDIAQPQLNAALKAAGHYEQLPHGAKGMMPSQRTYKLLHENYVATLRKLWPWLAGSVETFSTAETKVGSNLKREAANINPHPVAGSILVAGAGKFLELRLQFHQAKTGELQQGKIEPVAGMLLRREGEWFLPADDKTLRLMAQFPAGFVRMSASSGTAVFTGLLPALRTTYRVDVEPGLMAAPAIAQPAFSLHLTEQGGKHLVLIPRYQYGGKQVEYEVQPDSLMQEGRDGLWQEIVRDTAAETAFGESIRALHPLFEKSPGLRAFFIPFSDALRDGWYQQMLADMAARGVTVTGQPELQHFRYNPNQAKVSITSGEEGGSGIDWFDLLIEISFGDQAVSLKEVRRALINGQAGVRLGDGSIGLLPENFRQEYGALFRLGDENKDGGLRVNKLHFTLIDSLHEAALSKDVRAEIAAKKKALREIENIGEVELPEGIRATLRPYQAAGYQWLQLLHRLGWGGCLADDMGLGKTLQAITFLQHLKAGSPGSIHLVVCPTSLIFNWQAELQKFAPDIRYHIHYGAGRAWDADALRDVDVVITSYGILRSDLALLVETSWHYVILDESQAIKNPDAQTTKAAQALPAKGRLCLSGTPLQNNTFDLYAQFQFLNPGLLGSRETFRAEFATPIDKYAEEGPRATLRRMLMPFMLRRTKEQVAKDLPDKTEAIFWCEMDSEQRAVYDEYRHYYRDSLLNKIDEEGMAGAAFHVLEALLRLRQLCDHPALVKNKEVKTSESVKLKDLRREIRENTGGRKVLVFSQFTEMLALISAALTEDGISFAYLDGKTPAAKRGEEVERFQTDPTVQVFLISLKAGGVGLNLTAAEYVYLVDPWWNPAVEAQAIDRTHRIGQTAKIIAYRMICKDTVEEKVMMLQSRKRALAEGLVTEDAGFVKKLTRDDVAFLLG